MARRAAQWWLLVLAAVGMIAVLAYAGLNWRSIAVEYHLRRMRSDPARWLEATRRPQGTPAFEAARRFLDEEGAFPSVLAALGNEESAAPSSRASPSVLPALPSAPRALQNDGEESRDAEAIPGGSPAVDPSGGSPR